MWLWGRTFSHLGGSRGLLFSPPSYHLSFPTRKPSDGVVSITPCKGFSPWVLRMSLGWWQAEDITLGGLINDFIVNKVTHSKR